MEMAMSVTLQQRVSLGSACMVLGVLSFDNSYPTGGLAVPMASLGAKVLYWFDVADAPGRPTRWNGSATAPKVLAVQDATPAAAAALPEVANATDLSAVVNVPFIAIIQQA